MRGAIRASTWLGVNGSRHPANAGRNLSGPSCRQAPWRNRCSLPVYQNLSGDVTSAWQTRQDLASHVKETEELVVTLLVLAPGGPASGPQGKLALGRRSMTEKTVVLVGTLDTKGAEYQYMR